MSTGDASLFRWPECARAMEIFISPAMIITTRLSLSNEAEIVTNSAEGSRVISVWRSFTMLINSHSIARRRHQPPSCALHVLSR